MVKRWIAAAGVCAGMALSGCAGTPGFATGAFSNPSDSVRGLAMGGQQPVSGAQVQLFTAGTTGNGSAPTSLLTTPVYTDASGHFTITNDYPCALGTEQVYLTITGGQPTPGVTNSNLFLMSAIGNCSTLKTTPFLMINEITTVASIYALAPFMGSGGAVGASATNAAGLANAFSTVGELVNVGTAATPGPALPSGSVLESQKILALADALASCINSDGTTACSSLFTATAANGVTPQSVPDAIANLARNPVANPSAVYGLIVSASAPFATTLSATPHDWSISISYGSPTTATNTCGTTSLCQPTALAIDANGNPWVDNYSGGVVKFSPLGVYQTVVTGGGMANSYGMAIDPSNNIWVVNEGGNSGGSVSELSATSATNSTTPVNYAASPTTNMYHPEAVAASAGGMVWVADNVNPILLHSGATVFTSGGSIVSGSPFGGSVLSGPIAVALDANGTAWFANNTSGTVASISADGGTVHTYSCGGNGSQAIAVDRHGNVWVANYFANSISELSNTGTLLISGETGGGLNHPSGIAIDGAGTVWVSNYRSNSLTALAGADATTPGAVLTASGLGSDILTGDANKDPAMSEPYSVAVDPSGSVWVANYGSDALVRFIGLATPVKTPLDGPAQVP